MELIFAEIKFRDFWSILRKLVFAKIIGNRKFVKFTKFDSCENRKFLNRENQIPSYPCKHFLNVVRKIMATGKMSFWQISVNSILTKYLK